LAVVMELLQMGTTHGALDYQPVKVANGAIHR
jgi:hypothetical protein